MPNIYYYNLLPTDFQVKETIGDRIEKIKKVFGHTNITLGEVMKTNNSTVGKIITGKNNLTWEMLLELNANLDINLNWLLTGEGDMTIEKKSGARPDYVELLLKRKDVAAVRASLEILSQALLNVPQTTGQAVPVAQALSLGKTKNKKREKGSLNKGQD